MSADPHRIEAELPRGGAVGGVSDWLLAHPRIVAPMFGGLASLGFAPLGLWPLSLIAFAWLIGATARSRGALSAGLLGWLFGVGLFTIGNGWIATAFTYQNAMPSWLGWIAVFLLSLYLSLFAAVPTLLARLIVGRDGAGRLLVPTLALAGAWVIGEWLRSWMFTGFAWNPLGMVTLGGFARPGLARIAPWFGTYALSGLVVLMAGSWRAAWNKARDRRVVTAAALAIVPVILLLLPLGGSNAQGTLPFTLVQPNRVEEELNDPSKYEEQFQVMARLSVPRHYGERRVVLWPESGVPDYLRPGYPAWTYQQTTYFADPAAARARLAKVIGPGSLLLTGAIDLDARGQHLTAARNVVTALDSSGAIAGSYAKAHLVPYGEYLPMRSLLEPIGLSRLVQGDLDFQPGPGPATIDFGSYGKIGFQICYEIIFSGQVIDQAHRPAFLFNPSNDGWFGAFGPPQHLAQARMRAIEEGLPVLRSTTTGISAVIDADGVVRQSLAHGVADRMDGLVPPAHEPTLFSKVGNALPLGWAAIFLLSAVVARRRQRG
jgi:apolipoprotein N-acyltransferase